jgi:hypothetical protein
MSIDRRARRVMLDPVRALLERRRTTDGVSWFKRLQQLNHVQQLFTDQGYDVRVLSLHNDILCLATNTAHEAIHYRRYSAAMIALASQQLPVKCVVIKIRPV